MQATDTNLLAALADAEVLRHDVRHAEELLEVQRRHNEELVGRIERLERSAEATAERQRELHVLLLHRDEELVRLHEYLRSTREAPALPAPEAPPALPPSVEQRVLTKLAADAAGAAGWLSRILTRSQQGTTNRDA